MPTRSPHTDWKGRIALFCLIALRRTPWGCPPVVPFCSAGPGRSPSVPSNPLCSIALPPFSPKFYQRPSAGPGRCCSAPPLVPPSSRLSFFPDWSLLPLHACLFPAASAFWRLCHRLPLGARPPATFPIPSLGPNFADTLRPPVFVRARTTTNPKSQKSLSCDFSALASICTLDRPRRSPVPPRPALFASHSRFGFCVPRAISYDLNDLTPLDQINSSGVPPGRHPPPWCPAVSSYCPPYALFDCVVTDAASRNGGGRMGEGAKDRGDRAGAEADAREARCGWMRG